MKTDKEIQFSKIDPETEHLEKTSVFMNIPVPEDVLKLPHQTQTFHLSSKSDTFTLITLFILQDQKDNHDQFELGGILKCLNGSSEIKIWQFQLSTDPTERRGMKNLNKVLTYHSTV